MFDSERVDLRAGEGVPVNEAQQVSQFVEAEARASSKSSSAIGAPSVPYCAARHIHIAHSRVQLTPTCRALSLLGSTSSPALPTKPITL